MSLKNEDIEIGSLEESEWTKIRDGMKTRIEQGDRERIINLEVLNLAERMIKKEKI